MFDRQVQCKDCGFLSALKSEALDTPTGGGTRLFQDVANRRERSHEGATSIDLQHYSSDPDFIIDSAYQCFRQMPQFVKTKNDEGWVDWTIALYEERSCSDFQNWEVGYNFEQHIEARREGLSKDSERRWSVAQLAIGAVVGSAVSALLAVLIQLI